MAIKREESIKNIIKMFTRFSEKVLFENAVGFYDINKSSEPLFMNVLNRVYGLNLKDMNAIQHNFPAIDLGDEKSGICYQITSTGTNEKYQETVKMFKKNNLHKKYRELRFLLIGENKVTKKDTEIRTSVFTLKDLIKDVSYMPDDELAGFEAYFGFQMNDNHHSASILSPPLLAPNNSRIYKNFCSYHKFSESEQSDACNDLDDFLDFLRSLTLNERELLFYMVSNGHFPNANRKYEGDKNEVYIELAMVTVKFGSGVYDLVRALEAKHIITYDDEYFKHSSEYSTKAFRIYHSGIVDDFNIIAGLKDFLHDDKEALHDFFVKTDAVNLA